ncbi:hypothetical protein Bca4012_084371 [Brassica carinata]|uniref:Gnk2-homologous domain-containing protein n=1 Tax=Brassica carinata TaxID=52824 RepID=A0A8X7V7V7_BRACI|nr:hypothetical protein Bca52824_026393 [Brassica carinata]
MYSSSSTVTKRVILIHVLAIQLLLINSELPLNTTTTYLNHKCLVSQGKYKPGSEYEKLLKKIIKMFYKGSTLGYHMYGDSSLSALLQCRGDSLGSKCRDCFATALAALRRRCPRYMGRIIWYDQCLLSFDAKFSVGQIDYDNNFCMSNAKKLGDTHAFIMAWNILMDNLTTLAVDKNTNKLTPLYSAGETRFKGDMLYGMVQCTQDLTPQACWECMVFNSIHFQDCLNDKRGARFMSRSCTFRFEFYPFVANRSKIFKELNK